MRTMVHEASRKRGAGGIDFDLLPFSPCGEADAPGELLKEGGENGGNDYIAKSSGCPNNARRAQSSARTAAY